MQHDNLTYEISLEGLQEETSHQKSSKRDKNRWNTLSFFLQLPMGYYLPCGVLIATHIWVSTHKLFTWKLDSLAPPCDISSMCKSEWLVWHKIGTEQKRKMSKQWRNLRRLIRIVSNTRCECVNRYAIYMNEKTQYWKDVIIHQWDSWTLAELLKRNIRN